MKKLTFLALSLVATMSYAANSPETTGVCKNGCEIIYLTVPVDGTVGQRVVRDKSGQCWKDTFVEEATQNPSIKSMIPVSERIKVSCNHF